MEDGTLSVGGLALFIAILMLMASLVKAAYPSYARVDRTVATMSALVVSLFFLERAVLASKAGYLSLLRFGQFFVAGGICAFVTHAACTPIDVVKTRIQTMPGKYSGMMDGFRKIVSDEGTPTLLKGLGATAGGYFMHGAFKYSFYEVFKTLLSPDATTALKPTFSIASAAGFFAECIACMLLCPMEAVRIRSVSDIGFPSGALAGLRVIMRLEGVHGLYKGLPAMLLKQVPYTVGQFVSFELSLKFVKYAVKVTFNIEKAGAVSLVAGLLAGVAAGVISHPGDTILSKINQEQSEGSASAQIARVAKVEGIRGLFVGLLPRLVQVSCMIGGQFAIYDSIKIWCGIRTAAAIPEAVAQAVTGAPLHAATAVVGAAAALVAKRR